MAGGLPTKTEEPEKRTVIELENVSCAELVKALKYSTISTTGQTSMASPPHPATIEDLPDVILPNIFIHLLAKQLAQMRSVQKSWNSLLSESSFIKSHLHHSIHNNDQILLLFNDERDSNSLTVKTTRSPSLDLTNFIKLPVNPQCEHTNGNPRFERRNGIKIIGSINGLICSSYSNDSIIHIWNPSLSAMLTLPPYSTPSCASDDDRIKVHLRFGYDPKTDDYKVVKLTGLTGSKSYIVDWWQEIEIYSMRKRSWELITERFPSNMAGTIDGDYVCVDGRDGHLHWLGYTHEMIGFERLIISFDLGSETFREILFSHPTCDESRSNVFGILDGKLCVMSSTIGIDVYEMWVMEEYGAAESWVKRHVFSQFSVYIYLRGFTSHEILIADQGNLVLYDPTANNQKVLEDYDPPVGYGVKKIVEYVDSLVWVAPLVDGRGQSYPYVS